MVSARWNLAWFSLLVACQGHEPDFRKLPPQTVPPTASLASDAGAKDLGQHDAPKAQPACGVPQEKRFEPFFDSVGPLKIGAAAKQVCKALGEPSQKTAQQEEPAMGAFVQGWNYPSRGVFLRMASRTKGGSQTIDTIVIKAPATLKTGRGVGIGSLRVEVERAYCEERDTQASTDDLLVVGSVFGGVLVTFEQGKVTEIFIGASAE